MVTRQVFVCYQNYPPIFDKKIYYLTDYFTLLCSAAEYTDGLMPANAMITYRGEVFWPVPTKLQSTCKVDVTYFPFDEQKCKLKFGSWTYDGFQVNFQFTDWIAKAFLSVFLFTFCKKKGQIVVFCYIHDITLIYMYTHRMYLSKHTIMLNKLYKKLLNHADSK